MIFEKSADNTSSTSLTTNVNKLVKKYLPFHSASIKNLQTEYTGKYGIDRIEDYISLEYNVALKMVIPVSRTRTVTDWWSVVGVSPYTNYPLGITETQIYAGFTYPRIHVEKSLRTEDLHELIPLTQTMMGDAELDPHDMKISYGFEKILAGLYNLEENRVSHYIKKMYCADYVEITYMNMRLDDALIDIKSYHIPAFIYTYPLNDTELCKIISGWSGLMSGEIILSPIKVGSVFGIAVGIGSIFITGPIGTSILLLRLLLLVSASGVTSGAIAHFISMYKHERNNQNRLDEQNANKEHEQTDGDVERLHNTQKNNVKYALFIDECKILGLNSNIEITLDVLKRAYLDQIKKWHPDTYKGDKRLATEMTGRINEAYTKLKIVIKTSKN